ncbi:MAG: isochorismate synthase [Ornithinimicrobium sp.]
MTVIAPPRLRAQTVEITDDAQRSADLLDHVPAQRRSSLLSCWLREGDGIVAWGRVAHHRSSGVSRFVEAEQWWQEVRDRAVVEDPVGLPGSGLVTFGSFSFSSTSGDPSRLVIPEVIIGRRSGRMWRTTISNDDTGPAPDTSGASAQPAGYTITMEAGSIPAAAWPRVISRAVERIESAVVHKVVLARDEVARADGPIDVHRVLRRLSERYDATWTFAVDGLVGATPEMLVRLVEGRVHSRVLAGTVRRDQAPGTLVAEDHPDFRDEHYVDPRLRLISSGKDLDEHAYAVRSVAEALAPHCRELQVPEEPFVLKLPDVYHLASDISGEHSDGATSLRLAAALHPSAAVCGTPAEQAAAVITELEGMDRGRYAGPVGWMDGSGEGDWGIALRCGELGEDRESMRLFAGGGIVAASDPDAELAETEIKLAAMRYALEA